MYIIKILLLGSSSVTKNCSDVLGISMTELLHDHLAADKGEVDFVLLMECKKRGN